MASKYIWLIYLRRIIPFKLLHRSWIWLTIGTIFLTLFILIANFPQKNNYTRPDWVSVRLKPNQREYVDRRGVHVVVGHYIGEDSVSSHSTNITKDIVNRNNFNPSPWEGKNGMPVIIPSKDILEMQHLFQINRFNLLASDRIPLNRTLPDVRKKKCLKMYQDISHLPTTTVIIVFHNEAWSTLLRTVWSVINRSPRSLLLEIILVDDASDRDFLRQTLDDYVSELPVATRVIRIKERKGLINARIVGAQAAQGDVLTFLDAHCECTVGWLESLLDRIAQNRKAVVCPVIDIISDDTFAYVKSFQLHWGAFNWELHFRWFTLQGQELNKRKQNITQPFYTPAMAGGLFAIDRKYFFELGAYDEGMKIWGGENIELSFRVWQCGGVIEIVPCSHVGHLFRKSSPYTFPGGVSEVLYSNLARVATVWMDEWADFYFKFNPEAAKVKVQKIEHRQELRERLKCKSFKWYLDNVWPQHFFPTYDRFFGKIIHVKTNLCLKKPVGKGSLNQPMGRAVVSLCLPSDNLFEMFVMTKKGFIMSDDSICITSSSQVDDLENLPSHSPLYINACGDTKRKQWIYNSRTQQVKHKLSGLCWDLGTHDNVNNTIVLNECSNRDSQKWNFKSVPWK